jgi:hypothetical protein
MHTRHWPETLKERDYSQELDVDGKILDWIFGREDGKVGTKCIWLRIRTDGGLLEAR